jgi:hypothetical protein
MADDKKDPRVLLTDAVRRRDELNAFIRVMQEMLGEAEVPSSAAAASQKASRAGSPVDDPLSTVHPGMFFGKSKPQAVEMLLREVGTRERPRPLKLTKVLECLKAGGMEITDKRPLVNLWGTLSRNETFVRAGKAGWGLAEWYDAAMIAKMRKDRGKDEEENGAEK